MYGPIQKCNIPLDFVGNTDPSNISILNTYTFYKGFGIII